MWGTPTVSQIWRKIKFPLCAATLCVCVKLHVQFFFVCKWLEHIHERLCAECGVMQDILPTQAIWSPEVLFSHKMLRGNPAFPQLLESN